MRLGALRVFGISVVALAALISVMTFWSLWTALGIGAPTTSLGLALNFAPRGNLFVIGLSMVTSPRPATLAFWIAPLWAPLFFWIWAGNSVQPTIGYTSIVIVVVSFFSYLAMLIVGFPAYLIMKARRWTSLRAAATVGTVAGLSVSYFGLVLMLLSRGPQFVRWTAFREALDPRIISASTVLGALVGVTFWIIARPSPRAPDR